MPQHPDSSPSRRDARTEFLTLLQHAITSQAFAKLSLGKYHGPEEELTKVLIRRITLRNEDTLTFVHRWEITPKQLLQERLK